jgi:tRNA threonylcarbamoyladenosine biosynthesis protein TsaB
MTVLGIETATTVCAVAVVRGTDTLSEESIEEENVHAEKVLTLLDAALNAAGCSLREIDAIAVSIGPGSFTGLRIGLSTAKGLASGLGKTLIAVPTLHALANRLVKAGGAVVTETILCLLDARRDEVYCQCFRADTGRVVPLWDERDLSVGDLATQLDGLNVVVTGDGWRKFSAYLQGKQTAASIRFADEGIAKCSAASVALLGAALLREGRQSDPRSLEPLYIKDFYFKSKRADSPS